MGYSPSGLFGYTHMMGGYAGGQAQYARVPFADVGPLKLPAGIPDDKVVFLSDIYPTGYFGAVNADIEKGDTVAVWGCGPVAQFAIRSAFTLGAERVIAIDRFDYRLRMAEQGGAEVHPLTTVVDVLVSPSETLIRTIRPRADFVPAAGVCETATRTRRDMPA